MPGIAITAVVARFRVFALTAASTLAPELQGYRFDPSIAHSKTPEKPGVLLPFDMPAISSSCEEAHFAPWIWSLLLGGVSSLDVPLSHGNRVRA